MNRALQARAIRAYQEGSVLTDPFHNLIAAHERMVVLLRSYTKNPNQTVKRQCIFHTRNLLRTIMAMMQRADPNCVDTPLFKAYAIIFWNLSSIRYDPVDDVQEYIDTIEKIISFTK